MWRPFIVPYGVKSAGRHAPSVNTRESPSGIHPPWNRRSGPAWSERAAPRSMAADSVGRLANQGRPRTAAMSAPSSDPTGVPAIINPAGSASSDGTSITHQPTSQLRVDTGRFTTSRPATTDSHRTPTIQ